MASWDGSEWLNRGGTAGAGGPGFTDKVTNALLLQNFNAFAFGDECALAVNPVIQDPLCTGDANGNVTAAISAGAGSTPYTFTWSDDPLNPIVQSGLSVTRTGLPAGVYSLTVKDAAGCETTVAITLTGSGTAAS